MDNIVLSIIVPLYNAEAYIKDCLISLLNQGLDEDSYEIVIVNDGSTDNGFEIVEEFSKKYQNIRIIHQKNAGQSAARNVGIRVARGEYICFVDADDFLIRNKLHLLVDIAKKNNVEVLTYDIIGGYYSDILQKCRYVENTVDLSMSKIQAGVDYIAEYNYNNGPWYYLIKRSFLQKINLFFEEGKKCEDGIFTMNLFLEAHLMLHVDLPVYCYVVRANSTVTAKSIEHQRLMIEDFRFAVFRLTEIISKYKEYMSYKCLQRCLCRRDSYIFFLLIRMMKAKISRREVALVLESLKKSGLYPFKSLALDYPGKQIQFFIWILNNSSLYSLLCYIYSVFKK